MNRFTTSSGAIGPRYARLVATSAQRCLEAPERVAAVAAQPDLAEAASDLSGPRGLTGSVRWIVDGNNVMGAGADGWWNDPVAAAARLTQVIAEWTRRHDDDVTVVFDGAPEPRLTELAGGRLTVAFATRRGRNAADDRIVELIGALDPETTGITVVTSDRGLLDRLPPGVAGEGAGRFRSRIGLGRPGGR